MQLATGAELLYDREAVEVFVDRIAQLRLGGQSGVVAHRLKSWVVPVALLDYKERRVALVAAPDGSVVAVA